MVAARRLTQWLLFLVLTAVLLDLRRHGYAIEFVLVLIIMVLRFSVSLSWMGERNKRKKERQVLERW
jgi:hypothetical protein